MIKPALVTLVANRWTPFAYVIAFRGADLSGADLHAQVRIANDAAGVPLIDLPKVDSATAIGVRLMDVDASGVLPVSYVRLQIPGDRLGATLPAGNELGADVALAWDLLVTPVGRTQGRWMGGTFFVAPGATQLAAASLADDPSPGAADAVATLDGEALSVTLSGIEQFEPLLARAEANAKIARAAYRIVSTDADLAAIPDDERTYGLQVYVFNSGRKYEWGHGASGDAWIDLGRIHTGGAMVDGREPLRTWAVEDADGVMRLFLAMMADNGALRTSILEAGQMEVAGITYDARRAAGWQWVLVKIDDDGRAWAVAGVRSEGTWFPAAAEPARSVSTYVATPTIAARKFAWFVEDGRWIIFIGLGQSPVEAFNGDASDVAISTVPLHPSDSLMLDGTDGPRRRGQARTTTLVPLVEHTNTTPGVPGSSCKETYCSSFANHLIRDVAAATGKTPKIVSMVAAFGGQSIAGLSRGQDVWNDAINSVEDAVTAIRALGGTSIRTVIAWDQGEGDTGGSPLDRAAGGTGKGAWVYKMMVQKLFRELRADIMARTGEVEPPVVFAMQHSSTPPGAEWENSSRFGIVEAHGADNIRLVGPRYQLPYADVIHNTSRGRYLVGQLIANAVSEEHCGIGYAPLLPVGWYWTSATTLVVEISVLSGALVIDTSDTVVKTAGLANQGFAFDDGSGSPPAITNVQVWGSLIGFTFARAPTGPRPRLAPAITRNSGNTAQDGPVIGARCTIRNDVALPTIGGGNQYQWLCAFPLNLF
ncbi:sialate O-acetylesterase [Sphingomonas sp. RB3P16]|uniref:sialate O-acetylesterase n=1 Tax=Parasphingomonas frigoris TaxID=3096163 RepID=UPI002FC73E78